jgi:tripartite ATP-independent transporter DctP family solute receptor
MRKYLAVVMCVFFLGMGVALGGAAEGAEFDLKLGHVVAENTPLHQGALMFADMVKEKTNGRVTVSVYANAALGDNRSAMEALQFGILDIQIPNMATISGYTNKTKAFELPYIIKNDAAADAIFDGPIGEEAFVELNDKGLVFVASFSQGWRELTTSKREVHKPEDMKGLKIRTMDSQLHMDHFNALGASAVPMSFSEVFTALQQGAIDGEENPYTNIYTQAYHEVQQYIVETDHICDITPMIMSKITYDKLPEDLLKIIFDCAKEIAPTERKMANEGDKKAKEAIQATGKVTIITLTPEEKQAFFDAAQSVYAKWSGEIGADFIKKIVDAQKDF